MKKAKRSSKEKSEGRGGGGRESFCVCSCSPRRGGGTQCALCVFLRVCWLNSFAERKGGDEELLFSRQTEAGLTSILEGSSARRSRLSGAAAFTSTSTSTPQVRRATLEAGATRAHTLEFRMSDAVVTSTTAADTEAAFVLIWAASVAHVSARSGSTFPRLTREEENQAAEAPLQCHASPEAAVLPPNSPNSSPGTRWEPSVNRME